MRNIITVITICFLCTSVLIAQNNKADSILGKYYTENNRAKVEIIKRDNKYFGIVIWTAIEGLLDTNNPDKKEQNKKVVGKEVLKDFVFVGDNVWEKGTIYDPKNGKTYSCKITRTEKGDLKVRGFIGVSLIGRTTEWKKAKE